MITRTRASTLLLIVVFLVVAHAQRARADVPKPTVTGPVPATATPGDRSHNYPFFASNVGLSLRGYVEEEFFISGTANRYDTPALATARILDADHPYQTRILVRRPVDSRRFNGTVVVEWDNVTNGFDADNLWFFGWEHLMRAGYAWVGVSAQRVGVDKLRDWNASRYGALDVTQGGSISNDALQYDIFSQAAQAIRHPVGVDPLHGLGPKVVIAAAESQSAFYLSTYVNAIEPLARIYDGYLLLSSRGRQIRSDLSVPVWKISTEYDVAANEAAARQPDTRLFRAWEVAGTSHVDQHLREGREPLELRDLGTSSEAALATQCADPILGTRVPTSDVLGAAFEHLGRWITKRIAPPRAPKIEITSLGVPVLNPTSGFAQTPAVLARDALGLARGGIRLSQVAVPTGLNVGTNSGPDACVRWGYYVPFDVAKLTALYPDHARYVARVAAITNANVRNGFILPADAQRAISAADGDALFDAWNLKGPSSVKRP